VGVDGERIVKCFLVYVNQSEGKLNFKLKAAYSFEH